MIQPRPGRREVPDNFLDPPAPEAIDRALQEMEPHLVRGDRVGPYEILDVIGTGGMGCVHRARRADDAFEQEVAIKVVSGAALGPAALRRFHRERQILARLEHPGITRLIDGGTTADGLPYLAMELVHGEPIDLYCHRHDRGVRDCVRLVCQVCQAVRYAHRNLVVHRDIKPGNVLVDADGSVKLLDFGVSRLLHETGGGSGATATAAPFTMAYASPEQIRGLPVTTSTDVYSLGATLYALLAGRPPHDTDPADRLDGMRRVCEEVPRPPSEARRDARGTAGRGEPVDGDLDTIVLMALRHDPARRYETVEQFEDDLRRYLAHRPVRARGDSLTHRLRSFVRRNRPLTAVSAASIVAILLALAGVSAGLLQARAAGREARDERDAAIRAESAAREALRFYQDTLLSTNPYRYGRSATVLELMAEADARIDRDLRDEPRVEAGVRLALAETCASLMMWPEALPHAARAVSILRDSRGDELMLASALSVLGRAQSQMGLDGAIDSQREALRIRWRRFGPDHAEVAESTGNLGYALWTAPGRAEWSAAEQRYLEALAIFDRIGEGGSRDAARVTMSLGFMYARQDRLDEALARYDQALAAYAKLPVTEDLYEITTLSLSAHLLERQGRFEDALDRLESMRSLLPGDSIGRRHERLPWRIADLRRRTGAIGQAVHDYRAALAEECRRLARLDAEHRDELEQASVALEASAADGAVIDAAVGLLARLDPAQPIVVAAGLAELAALLESSDPATARRTAARVMEILGHAEGLHDGAPDALRDAVHRRAAGVLDRCATGAGAASG